MSDNDSDAQSDRDQLEQDLVEVRKLSAELDANPYSHDAYINLINKFKTMGPFMSEELQNARSSMAETILLLEGMFTFFIFCSMTNFPR